MNKIDEGSIHITLTYMVLVWIALFWCVLLQLVRAEYTGHFIEDCLTQANLAAIVVDPYHYGRTGELRFKDVRETKLLFEEFLEESLGDEENREKLGIAGPIVLQEFRVYEVTESGITEAVFDDRGVHTCWYDPDTMVKAPDDTIIHESALYSRIEVPVKFMFNIEVKEIKEHCVDIKGEVEDEQS